MMILTAIVLNTHWFPLPQPVYQPKGNVAMHGGWCYGSCSHACIAYRQVPAPRHTTPLFSSNTTCGCTTTICWAKPDARGVRGPGCPWASHSDPALGALHVQGFLAVRATYVHELVLRHDLPAAEARPEVFRASREVPAKLLHLVGIHLHVSRRHRWADVAKPLEAGVRRPRPLANTHGRSATAGLQGVSKRMRTALHSKVRCPKTRPDHRLERHQALWEAAIGGKERCWGRRWYCNCDLHWSWHELGRWR